MIVWAWVGVAEGRPRPPKPVPAPPAPAAPPPPTAPAPAAVEWVTAEVPGLVGDTAVLTGEKNFARDSVSMSFEFDLKTLDQLDEAQVDALFALLAADGSWRVGFEPGGRVATLRAADGPGIGGWHVGSDTCTRLALVETRTAPFAGPRVASAPASASSVKVAAFKPGGGPPECRRWATALVIDGARVDVEVFESGAVDARPFTLSALEDVPRYLSYARLEAARLAAEGHLDAPAAFAGPPLAAPGTRPGTIRLERWLDPGAAGRIWVRVVDGAGAPVHEAAVGAQTLQLAGWSPGGLLGFPVGSVIVLPPGPATTGAAEWWFQGADGAARLLASDPIALPAR